MKIAGSNIEFLADPNGLLTKQLDMELTHGSPTTPDTPVWKLGAGRSKRFTLYVEDGTVKVVALAEAPDDPAGDDDPSNSCIDSVLGQQRQIRRVLSQPASGSRFQLPQLSRELRPGVAEGVLGGVDARDGPFGEQQRGAEIALLQLLVRERQQRPVDR